MKMLLFLRTYFPPSLVGILLAGAIVVLCRLLDERP